jgi:ABC-type nitrate/sulfonate/bicarbonate transport system substrate-binding protein
MELRRYLDCILASGAALLLLLPSAAAEDTLKVASPQRGAWESSAPELGQQAGIFKKHGITLDLLYTQGSYEAQQRVISGSVDLGLDIVFMDVLRASVRGAPVRIIGANVTGSTNYWYVLKTSPIRTIEDLVGKTIAYEENGSVSQYNVLDFVKKNRVKAKLVPTGGPAATFNELVAGRVDVGWAAPPFGIDKIEQGEIRVIARANDVPRIQGMTVSVLITNAASLQRGRDVLTRFMQAYRETIDWMYSDPVALQRYLELAGLEGSGSQLREKFITKDMLSPDKLTGLRTVMKDANVRLSRRQVAELIQIIGQQYKAGAAGWFPFLPLRP